MKLYGMRASGNCYKALLAASMLGLELEWIETDLIAKFLPADHPRRADLPRLREKSREALGVMETVLSKRTDLASTGFGIADIALFAYTHDAPSAGIALDEFPHVTAWLDRVRAQPGFVPQ